MSENDGRLIKTAEYGAHIALRCRRHPDKRWSTKNISPIGCRRIFYNLHDVEGMGPECDCSLSELEPVPHANDCHCSLCEPRPEFQEPIKPA